MTLVLDTLLQIFVTKKVKVKRLLIYIDIILPGFFVIAACHNSSSEQSGASKLEDVGRESGRVFVIRNSLNRDLNLEDISKLCHQVNLLHL